MTLPIGAVAPDFEAETSTGRVAPTLNIVSSILLVGALHRCALLSDLRQNPTSLHKIGDQLCTNLG